LEGNIPPELGNLSNLDTLNLFRNEFTGSIPRSFLNLQLMEFRWALNDGLCAPPDEEFQGWLDGFTSVGPTCISTVSVEESNSGLPMHFALHGSYPNPFREAVTLRFDLPYSADVDVEIIDMMGRTVHVLSPVRLSTGWAREIELHIQLLPPGTYIYRLNVDSPKAKAHTGRFVKVR